MTMYLRKCAIEDFDTLRELSIRTYYETFAHLCTAADMEAYLTEAFEVEKLKGEVNCADCDFYFLYCDEKIAGYMKLNEAPSQSDINDSDSLEIERIYVVSEYQGRGLGDYLMREALAIAQERNKRYVWLGVWERNEKAIGFYRHHGFHEIGTHTFVMGEDVQTDFIMKREFGGVAKGL